MGSLIVAAAVGVLLVAPSASSAAVTIGSDLAPAPVNGLSCSTASCTWANTSLPGQQITSPVNGVVVRWRVRVASTPGADMRLKVIRPVGSGYQGVNTSTTRSLPASGVDTTHEFATTQPIAVDDQVAVDIDGAPESSNTLIETAGPSMGVTELRWEPSLADSEARDPTFTFVNNGEVLLNADVEPDCDSDGLGDETQDADTSTCTSSNPDSPPDTTITGGPSGKTRKKSATFTYTGTDASGIAGFQCRLDEGPFESCTASKTYSALKKGEHTFEVRAVDNAGNVDPTPAKRTWKVKKKKKKKKKK
jgi:hypothetical protein